MEDVQDNFCVLYKPTGSDKVYTFVDAVCLAFDEVKTHCGKAVREMCQSDAYLFNSGHFILGYAFEGHIIERDFTRGHLWNYHGRPDSFSHFLRDKMPQAFFIPKLRKELKRQLCMNAA